MEDAFRLLDLIVDELDDRGCFNWIDEEIMVEIRSAVYQHIVDVFGGE